MPCRQGSRLFSRRFCRLKCFNHVRNGGGGVCIYVRTNINFQILADLSPSNIEWIAIDITRPQSKPFLVSTWLLIKLVVDKIYAENLELCLLSDLN